MTPATLRSQAETLRHAGRAAEAVELLLQALALAPTDTDTYLQLGFALQALGLHGQASEALRTPAILNPGSVMAQGYLIHATQKAADWSQLDADLAALRAALAAKPDAADDEFGMPFALVGLPHTRAELKRAAELASRHVARGIRPLPPRRPDARARIRVGYLSADFHAHATAALLVDLLESHDRERFEVRLYSHGPDDGSRLSRRVREAAEHFIDVGPLDLAATAERIRADGVDILIDLKGHTAGSRMAALAYRPAPVQVSWLGFPGTSGAGFIDYVIGDPIVTPLADAADYSECIAQLPHCYQPQDRRRVVGQAPSRAQLGLRDDALVLLGANAVYKITPALWAAWMDVLRRLPEAQLWQLSGGEQADARLREAAGDRADRIVFAPPVGMDEHLARLAAADLALDSWPCNGHTTTSDALAAGVPVITLATDTFPGRVAASILAAAGLDECVTTDAAAYVDRICELGRNPAARAALRERIAARPAGLYDTSRFARELEALYQRMWQRALAGQPPSALGAGTRDSNVMKSDSPTPSDAIVALASALYEQGQLDQAAKGYRRALNLDPDHPIALRMLGRIALRHSKAAEALKWLTRAVKADATDAVAFCELGRAQRATGDRQAALSSLRQALAIQPGLLDAVQETARLSSELGQVDGAVDVFRKAIASSPHDVALYLGLARLLRGAGRTADSAEVLLTAQKSFPADADVYLELGSDLAAMGNWEGAATCFAARCQLIPGDAVSQYNWGVALQELGRVAEAIEAFERAIGLNPNYAAAYFGLGLAYRELGALDAALMALDLAVTANSADPRFPLERARVLLAMNNPPQALKALDALLSKHPNHAEAMNVKGVALKGLYRQDEALAAYDQAIRLQPDLVDARINRANLRLLKRNFSAALSDLDEARRLKPDSPGLSGIRLYTSMHLYAWTDFDQTVPELIRGVEQGLASVQPLAMECFVDDPDVQQKTARAWAASILKPDGTWQRAPGSRRPGKIRVAYVSGDFKSHPVSFLMAEAFELHDRDRFELIALNFGAASNDPMQGRLRQSFDQFYDVEHLPDQRIAELARSLDVDIAVDISGFTAGARTTLFAWRLAPVQVMYIGYLGTSGSTFYDYVIADPVIVTPEMRAYYDEKVITLPWYQANDRKRPSPQRHASRAALGLPEAGFVFCSFNNPSKLTPDTFDAWVEILGRVPGSVLWLLGEEEVAKDNLRQSARARGLDPSRLVFAKRGSRETYLANLATADLFLDTLPYNAGTTASDALWMGLPVLTRKGRSFAGRVAASVLLGAGLPELIADSRAQYVDLAVNLALKPELLQAFKTRLRETRATCHLFDAPAFTRHLEAALARALDVHEQGGSPADIQVTP